MDLNTLKSFMDIISKDYYRYGKIDMAKEAKKWSEKIEKTIKASIRSDTENS